MKPISLTLEAFGPYLDRTHIDFEKLNEAGLFLICGSTGGGKTTLLDAMSIALFGRATGGRRTFADMRALSAGDAQSTDIEFIFSLGADEYRFHRALLMHKKRGTDIYEMRDLNECYKRDGEGWVLAESGADRRVTVFAQELLHLTAEQFSQVIVLPQGEFLRLLRASSRDKADILKTLFSSEIWGRVTFRLNDRLKAVEGKNRDCDTALHALLEKHKVDSCDVLETLAMSLAEKLEETEKAREAAQKKRDAAQKALDRATHFARVKAEAEAADGAAKAAAEQLAAAESAAKAAEAGRAEIEVLRQKSESLTRRSEALKQERTRILQRDALQGDIAAGEKHCAALAEAVQKAESDRKAALEAIQRGEQYAEAITKSAAALPALLTRRAALEDAKRRLTALLEATQALESCRTAQKADAEAALNARLSMTAADKAVSAAEAALRSDSAAHLAAFLEDGAPCPVCGAVHHPAPAVPQGESITPQELDALRRSLRDLQAAHTKAEGALAAADARLKDAEARLEAAKAAAPKDITEDALAKEQAALAAEIADAEKKAAHREAAQKKLAALRTEAERAAEAGSRAAAERAAAVGTLEALRKQLAALSDLRTAEAVRAEEDSVKRESEACTTRSAALEAALSTAGEALAAATERSAAAKAHAAETAKALLECGEAPKEALDVMREALQTADEALNALSVSLGGTAEALDSVNQSLEAARALLKSAEALRAEYSRVARLSKLLSGQNARRTPILQYVLSMMLDETIYSANKFFTVLSRGRYALRRMTAPKSGTGYSGLDIEVLDGMSGTCRSIETLSGGEQFLASLSLAFGLSEVVQGYSGAVRLDSIFIDEGFGSLDGDTLDTAMRALETIRLSGRTIGIISHVAELQNRIPTMIRVSKKENGSAAARVIAEL